MRTQPGKFTLCGDGLCVGRDSERRGEQEYTAPARSRAARSSRSRSTSAPTSTSTWRGRPWPRWPASDCASARLGDVEPDEESMSTIEYAVTNPATGEKLKTFETIGDDALKAAIGRAHDAHRGWGRGTRRRGAGEGHRPRRRAAHRAPRRARGDHRARDGQADRAGARRGRLQRGDLPVLRRQRGGAAGRRADRAARRRGLGVHPAQLGRAPARDHAVELPLLPGGPLRRPEPGDRQHDPPQARAAVPGVGRGDGADLPRGGRARRTRTSTSTRPTSRSSGSSATRACRACR